MSFASKAHAAMKVHGVEVVLRAPEAGVGEYDPVSQTILVDPDQDEREFVRTLAHEMVHALMDLGVISIPSSVVGRWEFEDWVIPDAWVEAVLGMAEDGMNIEEEVLCYLLENFPEEVLRLAFGVYPNPNRAVKIIAQSALGVE